MKTGIGILLAAVAALAAQAEVRDWISVTGDTVRGEYAAVVFDHVVLLDAAGNRIRIPLSQLSKADAEYVELVNPPELKVDFLESVDQVFVKPSPMWVDNSPVTLLRHRFGARVRQVSATPYTHALVVEIYAVSTQVYDPDKYHLVFKWTSDPFTLDHDRRRLEVYAPRSVDLAEFQLGGEYPRGERFAESVVLVRDERGEIIACEATKNWLSAHMKELLALPEGAWFNREGVRVHPTSPRAVWFD